MEKLLVVEAAAAILNQLTGELGKDYTILQGADYAQAIDLFRKFDPKVVTLDLGLAPDPEGSSEGFRCLQWMLASKPDTKVVVLTGNGDWETAHRALRCGAYDFYQKPVNTAELKIVLRRAFQLSGLEEERRRLQETLERRGFGLESIVGQCAAMQRIFSAVQMVAASDVPVLITGESGTGKELVARTIKSLSARADGPFIPVKCSGAARDLLESELFGSVSTAFDGALSTVPGKIEHARKGTLFLEEPAKLPNALQARLLSLLQEKGSQRGGGGGPDGIDIRIICAAGVDLGQAMRAGQLLEDLYYRISVITLELPPLRARGEDIMLLAHLFLRRFAQACNAKARGFSPAAVAALESHTWPGNVRELEGRLQRGVIMSNGPLLEPRELGFGAAGMQRDESQATCHVTLREARDQAERKVISAAVASSRGNLAKASELLDVSRSTLYDLLKKHGLYNAGPRQ
jgi:two-component system, NtrC family, response regulator